MIKGKLCIFFLVAFFHSLFIFIYFLILFFCRYSSSPSYPFFLLCFTIFTFFLQKCAKFDLQKEEKRKLFHRYKEKNESRKKRRKGKVGVGRGRAVEKTSNFNNLRAELFLKGVIKHRWCWRS